MGSEPNILEISSDEEGGWHEPNNDHIDWINELLDRADNQAQESDEVVVLDEFAFLSKANSAPSNTKKVVVRGELDDDCVVLDGDPEKPVSAVDSEVEQSDDLLIVGEKGQLACRDYPHPRHLCATFPFNSTPYEKHCNLCHCYVCDIYAPCIYWSTGASSSDHCRATDKEEVWRVQRKIFKQGLKGALPMRKFPDTSISLRPPLHNSQATPLSGSPGFSSVTLPPVSKSTQFRACSVSSFGTPGILKPRPAQLSGSLCGRNRCPQYPNRSHQLLTRTHNIRKERHSVGTLDSRSVASHSNCKRVGSSGGAITTVSQSSYVSSHRNQLHTTIPPRSQSHIIPDDHLQPNKWQELVASMDSGLDVPQNSDSFTDFLMYNQHFPAQNANQNMCPSGSPAPNATDLNPLDLDGWLCDTSQGTQHSASANPQHPIAHPSCQSPQNNPGSPDFDLEKWMKYLDNEPEPVTDLAVSNLDYVPPQPGNSDLAMLLYDFENPWSSLAHV